MKYSISLLWAFSLNMKERVLKMKKRRKYFLANAKTVIATYSSTKFIIFCLLTQIFWNKLTHKFIKVVWINLKFRIVFYIFMLEIFMKIIYSSIEPNSQWPTFNGIHFFSLALMCFKHKPELTLKKTFMKNFYMNLSWWRLIYGKIKLKFVCFTNNNYRHQAC